MLNGATYTTTTHGSVIVDNAASGNITIALNAAATAKLTAQKKLAWGIKWKSTAGVFTLAESEDGCEIKAGPVKAIT